MPSDRICLDTNIVISILSNNAGGHREPQVWEGIREITRDIDRGRSRLVLPTLVFAELLPSHGHDFDRLEAFLERKAVEFRELTVKIARRAAELRDAGRLGASRALRAADAVFLATAEISGTDVLYSADPDVYRAVGTTVRLKRPYSRRMPLLPSSDVPPPWNPG